MAKNLYIIATEARSGKSAICLGVMQLLLKDFQRVAFFRPIISGSTQGKKDHDINLILSQFYLNMRYEDTFVYTLDQARDMMNQGKHTVMIENILAKYKELESKYDFVLLEGTDFLGSDLAFESDINAEIASNIGCPVILVSNGLDKPAEALIASTQIAIDTFSEKGLDIFATIVNRVDPGFEEKVLNGLTCKYIGGQDCLTYAIPEDATLGKPTVADVTKWLNAQVLYGQDQLDTPIDDYIVAAMQVGNFLEYIKKGALVITPGDRADVVLGCYASRLSTAYQDVAGIVLTGGIEPNSSIKKLIDGWTGVPLPVLLAEGHTYKVARILMDLYGRIESDDQKKIATALGTFEKHVNGEDFRSRLEAKRSSKITPKMFEYSLIDKAKLQRQHIVLPEGTSTRILKAADILLRRGVADLTILGKEDEVHPLISQLGLDLSGAQIVNPAKSEFYEQYWHTYYEMRKAKGVTEEMARDQMLSPTYFGTMMVQMGQANGMVSGSINTTQDTIRPALQIIKTKPGMSIVSSVFLMCLADRVLVFGDCAVNPSPNAQQLAEIAIQSAHTAAAFGVEPRIAMLSYSTGSSGSGAEVDKVREATKIAHEMAPELLLEGPLQYDAAIDPEVAALKMPGSAVAGKATVFIFPDLNTGNNTYKAVQRAASAVAIGPVLQGLNKPVNDLSRGCTVEDIVNTVVITAIQAQH
ncbi:phosphate acetyltransferase [Fundidesulfovibrio agrisoli]|uniref:phosphate acetyltransferase n=1 Tax=Fundidesulfovibrio agrisoli TaxID=2922717 RepID=UPI001FAD4D56|nr:phosphate acetyltransferase [Fundidesulfovibrio agrisoli]